MYKLLSFDVYGTLINTPPINAKAFRLILERAGASNIDALAFYQFWESRNISITGSPIVATGRSVSFRSKKRSRISASRAAEEI